LKTYNKIFQYFIIVELLIINCFRYFSETMLFSDNVVSEIFDHEKKKNKKKNERQYKIKNVLSSIFDTGDSIAILSSHSSSLLYANVLQIVSMTQREEFNFL